MTDILWNGSGPARSPRPTCTRCCGVGRLHRHASPRLVRQPALRRRPRAVLPLSRARCRVGAHRHARQARRAAGLGRHGARCTGCHARRPRPRQRARRPRFEQPASRRSTRASRPEPAAFEIHRVRRVRTYLSLDRRRMFSLYQAPDAESVRVAQREANMPGRAGLDVQPVPSLTDKRRPAEPPGAAFAKRLPKGALTFRSRRSRPSSSRH